MSNNTIIIENKILYSLLKEIENSLNLNIKNSANSLSGNTNSTDYLLFDIKKINLPIKIENLIEKINIQFLKEKYKHQSNIKISKYLLNLNSRTLNVNDKKLKLTEKEVNITITFYKGELVKTDDKILKLSTTKTITNMHAFDANENLKKYEKAEDMIDEFYTKRIEIYHKRKNKQLEDGYMKLNKLSNKARYIKCLLEDEIDLRKKKNEEIVRILESMKFDKVEDSYNYLIKMAMDSVSEENIEKIMKEQGDLSDFLKILNSKTIESIWLEELDKFEKEYDNNSKLKIKKKK